MHAPILAINWKNYTTGIHAWKAVLSGAQYAARRGIHVILLPPHPLLVHIHQAVRSARLHVYAQHADPMRDERATGFLPIHILRETGIEGVLLNHSEHPLPIDQISRAVTIAREIGLRVLIAGRTSEDIMHLTHLQPDFLAVEPPELIATGRSITRVKPRLVKDAVLAAGEIPLLVGAGIRTAEDATRALLLGARGILVASGIVHTPEPREALIHLADGLLQGWKRTRDEDLY